MGGMIMSTRATLSVGLNQDYANCELRKKFIPWLESIASTNAKNALQHIYELEGLMDVEKYASLSNMANDMRNHLAEIRLSQSDSENKAYQLAINLVIDKIEAIDIESQAATSIAEIQVATLLKAAEEINHEDDYVSVFKLAQDINDGCC